MKRIILSIAILGALATGCKSNENEAAPHSGSGTSATGTDGIKAEIQELENRYAAAVNSKNLDSIMPYYADDAISYDSEAKPLRGQSSIRASIQKQSNTYPKSGKFSFTVKEVLPSSDAKQVVEIGHYELKDSTGVAFGSGNYFAVFEKRDGKYVCVRDIQTPDSPRKPR